MQNPGINHRDRKGQLRLVHDSVRAVQCEDRESKRSTLHQEPAAVARFTLASARAVQRSVSPGIFLHAFASMAPGERMEFVHFLKHSNEIAQGASRYGFEVRAIARDGLSLSAFTTRTEDALRAGFPAAQFKRSPPSIAMDSVVPLAHAWQVTLAPLLAFQRPSVTRFEENTALTPPVGHALPMPVALPNWALTAPLNERLELPAHTEIVIRIHGFELRPADCQTFSRRLRQLEGGALVLFHFDSPREDYAIAHEVSGQAQALLRTWLTRPKLGYAMDCLIRGSTPLNETALARIAADIFGQRETCIRGLAASESDGVPAQIPLAWALRPEQALGGVFPDLLLLPSLGVPRHFEPPAQRPPLSGGTAIGHTVCGDASTPVVFPDEILSRHISCFGATGSGKSGFQLQLAAGHINSDKRPGVAVIDPHGQLALEILQYIPKSRSDDVVVVDVTDLDRVVCLNPLAGTKSDPVYAQFVATEIVALIDALFEGKDTSGPVGRNHIKNTLLLSAHVSLREGTFMDALRCLEDSDYGDYLVSKSNDRALKSHWEKFQASRGDNGIGAWLPHLIPRLSPFCSSPVMRRLLNRPQSTINIPEAMAQGKILVFNLSKAVLGETECRIAGSLILNQFFWAALARGRQTGVSHKPMHLIVDEFASFATDSAPRLLAEARKFGLCITTANQSIGQLRNRFGQPSIAQAVMANTATKLMFRLGPSDADLLQPYFKPGFSEAEMSTLPDFHAVISMPHHGQPLPPFVARIDRPVRDETLHATPVEVVSLSNRKYTSATRDANQELVKLFDLNSANLGEADPVETEMASAS